MKIHLSNRSQEPREAICDWYHKCIAQEVDENGFSIKQDFSYVECIDTDNQCVVRPVGRIFNDYVLYDPYKTILFIFYARDLYNKSVIHLECEVLWKDLHHRCGVLPCNAVVTGNFCVPTMIQQPQARQPPRMFYFPFLCEEKRKELSSHRAVLHDVIDYCDWVFANGDMLRDRIPAERLVGVQHLLYLLPPHSLWDSALCAKEHSFLSNHIMDASEAHVLQLIAYNYPRQKMATMMVKPSPLALWRFMQQWPNKAKPTWLLSIPMEQMPKEAQTDFVMRPGGRIEISYADILLWLWFTRNQLKYKMQTTMVTRPPPKDSQLVGMLEQIKQHIANRLKDVQPAKKLYTPSKILPNNLPIGDLEDLIDILPPCMLSFKDASRFPRHKERMDQTQTFKAAGISLDVVANFYNHYNNVYPHASGHIADAIKRYNYAYFYDRGTRPTYCKTIIRQTLNGETDCMQCPYATEHPSINLDDACGKAKLSCAKQNLKGMPRFSGPHMVMIHRKK